MKRDIFNTLMEWQYFERRLPLLFRGARQVGKTYIIESFAKAQFDNCLTINFELQPEYKMCFTSLEPQEIVNKITTVSRQAINPGRTLLFFDEIQDCKEAIMSLRYFKEKMPDLHVIGAGSLLKFVINADDLRIPVGRVQYIFLKPLSFDEFLTATDHQQLRNYLTTINVGETIPEVYHHRLLQLLREYFILGGMPAVVKEYVLSHNWMQCQNLQTAILSTYRNDFGKYAKKVEQEYLQRIFEKAPTIISQHFKYKDIDPDVRSRELKKAIKLLVWAGIINKIYATRANGLPLNATRNEKRFKLSFLDTGLVKRATHLEATTLLEEDLLLLNRGAMAEQFVAQELQAYTSVYEEPELFYWEREKRGSTAEVDFVTHVDSLVVPIEVKSGSTGRLKSLQLFLEEKQLPYGVRLSQHDFSLKKNVLSLPLYMTSQLSRLVKELRR